MARSTPVVQDSILIQDNNAISVDTPEWYCWLQSATLFNFSGKEGKFTARLEQAMRGGCYWKAYMRHQGRLYRTYLGKSENLTMDRLVAAAKKLAQQQVESPKSSISADKSRSSVLSTPPPLEDTILYTKFYLPVVGEDYVSRPRLLRQLSSRNTSVILISAPAGFGKTSLLSQWQKTVSLPVACLRLDKRDNDVYHFWTYVITALNQVQHEFGDALLALLGSPQRPPIEVMLTKLTNQLSSLKTGIVLILDDYQFITHEEIHQGVTFLVEYLPPLARIILSTRLDPPLPLARWRANGQLMELRADDLRFSESEIGTLFAGDEQTTLPLAELANLETRTEGWAAGLRMVLLALRGVSNKIAFINAFSGKHHLIGDYLITEILHQQSETIQRFLLQTSILAQMNGDLCQAVTGYVNSQEILETLNRDNMFVVPLDHERQWFRYHSLFAEALRQQLQDTSPQQIPELYQRAMCWYEQHSMSRQALALALDFQDYSTAAQLIGTEAHELLARGEFSKLQYLLQYLPDEVLRQHPPLHLALLWCYAVRRELSKIPTQLAFVEEQTRSRLTINVAYEPQAQLIYAEIAAIRSTLALLHGNYRESLDYAEQALGVSAKVPSVVNCTFGARLLLNKGVAYDLLGDNDNARLFYLETVKATPQYQPLYELLLALFNLALLDYNLGHLNEAFQRLENGLAVADSVRSQLPMVGFFHVALAHLYYEWNDLVHAEKMVNQGLGLCKEWLNRTGVAHAYQTLILIKQAQGKATDLEALVPEIEQLDQEILRESANCFDHPYATFTDALLTFALSNGEYPTQWALNQLVEVLDKNEAIPDQEIQLLLRILIHQHDADHLHQIIAVLEPAVRRSQRIPSLIMLLTVKAHLLLEQGEKEQALDCWENALALGQREGFVRTFIDLGSPISKLLQLSRDLGTKAGIAQEAYRHILETACQKSNDSRVDSDVERAILSERELTVLALLADGLTNQQVARKLSITVDTVKTHVRAIYRKLDVNNRISVVSKAKALNILR